MCSVKYLFLFFCGVLAVNVRGHKPEHWKKVWLGRQDLARKEGKSEQRMEVPIEEAIVRHDFANNTSNNFYTNDIALLRLANKVLFNDYISPICLPYSHKLLNSKFVGKRVYIGGWGISRSGQQKSNKPKLRSTLLRDVNKCNIDYARAFPSPSPFDKDRFCVGGKKGTPIACEGDAGGPLMRHQSGVWYAIGVTSFPNQGCMADRLPVPVSYTRVGKYICWILKTVGVDSRHLPTECMTNKVLRW